MEEAFIQLVQENEGLIHKVCHFYFDDKDERQDLFQEIILQLWKSYPQFKGQSKAGTWIYRIALNTAITAFRIEKKKGKRESLDALELPYAEDFEMQEKRKMLYKAINGLSPVEKPIMFLHLEGYSYDEIAEITGFSKTNVASRLNRIKTKVTNNLKLMYQ